MNKIYFIDNHLKIVDANEEEFKKSYPDVKYFLSEIDALYKLKEMYDTWIVELTKSLKYTQERIDAIHEDRQNNLG